MKAEEIKPGDILYDKERKMLVKVARVDEDGVVKCSAYTDMGRIFKTVPPPYRIGTHTADAYIPATDEQRKANNPRKYKRLMRKRSEQRKELWRKERLRQKYDIDRQTSLHIPLNPLSHRASSHKHAMIKCCNYFVDPLGDPHIICYDSDTQRSARREATAAKHGVKVVEADE